MTPAEEARGWREMAERIRQRLRAFPAFVWEAADLEEMIAGCEERARRLGRGDEDA